jgi:hypothetical protein
LKSQFVTSSQWGGRRVPPHVFTEQGVAMLSSVLNSLRAIQVNIEIMRTFVRLREMMSKLSKNPSFKSFEARFHRRKAISKKSDAARQPPFSSRSHLAQEETLGMRR